MSHALKSRESGFWGSLPISLLFHILVYGVLAWLHFLPSLQVPEGDVYYVDVVNLPVASPQAGSPSAGNGSPPLPSAASAPEMALPSPKAARTPAVPKSKAVPPQEKGETAREFEERLARLEKSSDARHAAAALEALQKRAQGQGAGSRGAVGVPKGTGNEAGSDYASYIRSRLADSFRTTIAYQSKRPETAVRLFIDRNGKLARIIIERSSKDRLFDDAVVRAIEKAKTTFPPTPNGKSFEKLFVFNPEEVTRQ